MSDTTSNGPLSGVRVLDLGHALAGPFAATMLGDFGADVIKVEKPGAGDAMRYLGVSNEDGPVWWKSMARNKRSIALDWTAPGALGLIERLVRASQVIIENFRPGVLERNGLGPDVLFGWNPDLVILRVSGYGQTGPYSNQPGFGKAAEAMSGVVHVTGFPDGPPLHPGFPMGDMTTGLMGAYGVVMALYAIRCGTARGQVIDLPIYETPMRLLDYHVPIRSGTNVVPNRNGNRQPMAFALSGIFRSKDGRWITYSCATYSVAVRVMKLIGAQALLDDPECRDLPSLSRRDDEINARLDAWMGQRTAAQVLDEFEKAQAVAALVYDTDDVLSDPHIRARGNIVSLPGERSKVVNVVPSLGATPGRVRWLGRSAIGADTDAVLRDVAGMDDAQIAGLVEAGIVARPPR